MMLQQRFRIHPTGAHQEKSGPKPFENTDAPDRYRPSGESFAKCDAGILPYRDRRSGDGGGLERLQLALLVLPDEARLPLLRAGDGGLLRVEAAASVPRGFTVGALG